MQLLAELNQVFDATPVSSMHELGLIILPPPPRQKSLHPSKPKRGKPHSSPEEEQFHRARRRVAATPEEAKQAFVCAEGNLGIAIWCVPELFAHCKSLLLAGAAELKGASGVDAERAGQLLEVSRALVLINPDLSTAWNARKRMLQSAPVPRVEEELALVRLVTSKHPKSGETWTHRRWVLRKLGVLERPRLSEDAVFSAEIASCARSCEVFPRNYYAWSYRQWLVERMTDAADVAREHELITKWTNSHVSDHCGFHHRQVVLYQALRTLPDHAAVFDAALRTSASSMQSLHLLSGASTEAIEAGTSLINAELSYMQDLLQRYPGHEAMWCHHRIVFIDALRLALATASPTRVSDLVLTQLGFARAIEEVTDGDRPDVPTHCTLSKRFQVWVLEHTLSGLKPLPDAAALHDELTEQRSVLLSTNPNLWQSPAFAESLLTRQ